MARPQSRDQRYQLTQTTAGSIMDYHYGHDPAGNIVSISGALDATVSGGTTTYSHDGNRLTEATGQEPAQYTCDDNGNTVSDGTRTFVYNQNNRLIRVEQGNTVLGEYAYDGLERRVRKTVSGTTTHFHYDPDGNLIAETASDGTPLRDYIYQNGERVAMRIYGAQAGTYYFLNDHLGTPRIIINDAGQIVWQAAYLPFGKAQVTTETVENHLRFPGQYFDTETGLHYNWHRYYDPGIGRYFRADPSHLFQPKGGSIPFLLPFVLGKPQELNLFSYVINNPVILNDIFGLQSNRYGGPHGWRQFSNDLRVPPSPPNQCSNKCKTSFNDCYSNCTLYYQLPGTPSGPSPMDIAATILCFIRCLDDKCRYDFVHGPLILI